MKSNDFLYTVSYDNFYMSADITKLSGLDTLIKKHIELEKKGNFSSIFCANCYLDYVKYELIQKNNDYDMILHFNDNGHDETFTISLIRCNIFY